MKTFAEFFAGIGLVRAGLAPGGWHCSFANDIEPKKQQMYLDHFGPSPEYHLGDVRDEAAVLSHLPGGLQLATASFPCTDLSLAGHWRGIDGQHSSTFFDFTRILELLGPARPPLILIENVVGLAKSNNGKDFARVCAELSSNGYWLDPFVLDAKWFVPQSRPRIFIVGVRENLREHEIFERSEGLFGSQPRLDAPHPTDALRPSYLHDAMAACDLKTGWLRSRLPHPPHRVIHLKDVVDADDKLDWWSDEDVERHIALMQAPSALRLAQLRHGDSYAVGTAFRRTRLGKPRTETRFDIAGCLRTPKGGSARQIVVRAGHGRVDLRWMLPIEYARLQGVPDFSIRVPAHQAMFGFGDAVCVPAIHWIDTHLLSPLVRHLDGSQQVHESIAI